jgi:hypothetical protein
MGIDRMNVPDRDEPLPIVVRLACKAFELAALLAIIGARTLLHSCVGWVTPVYAVVLQEVRRYKSHPVAAADSEGLEAKGESTCV